MTLRRIDIAVVFSLVVHGLIAAMPPIHKREADGGRAAPISFIAQLVDAPAKVEPAPQPVPDVPTPAPVVKPHPIVAPKVAAAAPIAVPVERPAPVEKVEPHEPQFDMMAMINARREQKHAYEEAMLQQARARDGAVPSASDPALAALNRNLSTLASDRDGTGGIFTILSMGQKTGEFSFNGWQPEVNRKWREVIEVTAPPGSDLEIAMVRRMIELIRSHYTGDFNWRSHRLGKTFTLSARPEDQADLEEFLSREFFGTPTLAHKR